MKKLSLAITLALASMGAQAGTISGLENTGAVVVSGQDQNYTVSNDTFMGSNGYVASSNSFPFPYWLANTASSSWLTPTSNQAQSFDPSSNGTYTWATTFTLASNANLTTASLSGLFAADNSAVAYLNGHEIGTSNGFSSMSSFSAAAGSNDFISGQNILTFVVTNAAGNSGNPTGLNVQFTNSNVSAVPEPESYGMMLGGLGLLGFMVRRKKSA